MLEVMYTNSALTFTRDFVSRLELLTLRRDFLKGSDCRYACPVDLEI